MAGNWLKALQQLERRDAIPSRWSILSLEVQRSYWDVLAYQHDGLTKQAILAYEDHIRCIQQLRDAVDPHPDLGVEAADKMVDRAIQQAQADFAEALHRSDWRDQRGRRPGYS